MTRRRIAIVGGGPAGLMAADVLSADGSLQVDVYDAMPSVGRKFLMAGKGGMNITHSEPLADFVGRYGARAGVVAPWLSVFGPTALRDWIHGLGIDTFIGTSGRVFPTEMKAAPLLRALLHRLRGQGVHIHVRHRWLGWRVMAGRCCIWIWRQGALGIAWLRTWPGRAVAIRWPTICAAGPGSKASRRRCCASCAHPKRWRRHRRWPRRSRICRCP